MKVLLTKKDLEAALNVVSSTLASTDDIFSHVLFRAKEQLHLLTCSNRVYSMCPVTTSSFDEGSFTVEGWRLKSWLTAIPDGFISLDYNAGVVKATCAKGTQSFPSLDPESFPVWDDIYTSSAKKGEAPAKAFKKAFDLARSFVDTNEGNPLAICAVEYQDGLLRGTDRKSLVLLEVPGLSECTFRVHTKDIGALVSFLGHSGESLIEVLEHERAFFLRNSNGAVFGEARHLIEFPVIKFDLSSKDNLNWEISRQDLVDAITFLGAGAPKDHTTIRFARTAEGVSLTMPAMSGGETSLDVKIYEETKNDEELSAKIGLGFSLCKSYVEKLLSLKKGSDSFQMGLSSRGNSGAGLARFQIHDSDVKANIILVWA